MKNNLIIVTQFSGYFVYKYFGKILFSKNIAKIYFVKNKRKNLIRELLCVFGLKEFLFLVFFEFFYLIIFFLKIIFLKVKVEFISYESQISKIKDTKLISIGSPIIFTKKFLNDESVEYLNLHGGILPYQRGLYSPYWASFYKDLFCGATLHRMRPEIDSGASISMLAKKRRGDSVLLSYKLTLTIASKILNDYIVNDKIYKININKKFFTPRVIDSSPIMIKKCL